MNCLLGARHIREINLQPSAAPSKKATASRARVMWSSGSAEPKSSAIPALPCRFVAARVIAGQYRDNVFRVSRRKRCHG